MTLSKSKIDILLLIISDCVKNQSFEKARPPAAYGFLWEKHSPHVHKDLTHRNGVPSGRPPAPVPACRGASARKRDRPFWQPAEGTHTPFFLCVDEKTGGGRTREGKAWDVKKQVASRNSASHFLISYK